MKKKERAKGEGKKSAPDGSGKPTVARLRDAWSSGAAGRKTPLRLAALSLAARTCSEQPVKQPKNKNYFSFILLILGLKNAVKVLKKLIEQWKVLDNKRYHV